MQNSPSWMLPNPWNTLPVFIALLLAALFPSTLSQGQWGHFPTQYETQTINDIQPGSPCEYNRDCAIISTGLKCLRGGCHCEYFRAEQYLDWTHPYYNQELHRCVIRYGEVCVHNITAAQNIALQPQPQGRALAFIDGGGARGRRPAGPTSPISVWKDYYYTCEPGTWCDPYQPYLDSRANGVCVSGAAEEALRRKNSIFGAALAVTATMTATLFMFKVG